MSIVLLCLWFYMQFWCSYRPLCINGSSDIPWSITTFQVQDNTPQKRHSYIIYYEPKFHNVSSTTCEKIQSTLCARWQNQNCLWTLEIDPVWVDMWSWWEKIIGPLLVQTLQKIDHYYCKFILKLICSCVNWKFK